MTPARQFQLFSRPGSVRQRKKFGTKLSAATCASNVCSAQPRRLLTTRGATIAMPTETVTLHPSSLSLTASAQAWYLREKEQWKWTDIRNEVRNIQRQVPSFKAIRNGVERVRRAGKRGLPQTAYGNCGRKKALTDVEERAIVAFVKQWRAKRFCTCQYIAQELRLPVTARTVGNVLNRHGYFWRRVPKVTPLAARHIAKRKIFVDKYIDRSVAWWKANMSLIIDGVTLTRPPRNLNGRQKHAAQNVAFMWMRSNEKFSREVHTFNRYGVQLGVKVPLWGGFTGSGKFALRLWTQTSKMQAPQWAKHVRALRKAIDSAAVRRPGLPHSAYKVWQDNEGFLQQPKVYKQHGLQLVNFPPNSGDLNPIETVWARLRRDLGAREMQDLQDGAVLTEGQYRKRAAQVLASYGQGPIDGGDNYLEKLIAGMPKRLQKCKANGYGRCGK